MNNCDSLRCCFNCHVRWPNSLRRKRQQGRWCPWNWRRPSRTAVSWNWNRCVGHEWWSYCRFLLDDHLFDTRLGEYSMLVLKGICEAFPCCCLACSMSQLFELEAEKVKCRGKALETITFHHCNVKSLTQHLNPPATTSPTRKGVLEILEHVHKITPTLAADSLIMLINVC